METRADHTRAGFVTIAGRPNAGKSSILNLLVGDPLAMTSSRAQSTRHRIVGIRSTSKSQMVLLDTPGLLEPRDTLHQAMRQAALKAVRDADVIVHVIDATKNTARSFVSDADLKSPPTAPIITVLNKIDLLSEDALQELRLQHPDAVFCSAINSTGLDELVRRITDFLPVSGFLYPEDEISTLPTRFFCAEYIREAAMEQLGDELPHALACEIEEFREDRSPLYIRAVLYVERESQKRIVIGAGGQQIKKLGSAARSRIEGFLGQPVYLDLWVKVLANWRKKRSAVLRLGYDDPQAAK